MRVLIIDDHQLVVQTLQVHLDQRDGWSVVAACTLLEGLEVLEADAEIDLILLDFHMPSDEGRRAEDIIRAAASCPVVVFSGDISAEVAQRVRRAGAKGFVPKTMSVSQLIGVMEAVSMGLEYFPADLMSEDLLAANKKAMGLNSLSEENQRILSMVAKGDPNKIIAAEIGLSEHVVKARLRTIFLALGVSNRVQAALAARELALDNEVID